MNGSIARAAEGEAAGLGHRDFAIIAELMHRHTGIHLPEAKRVMVEGRLAKRLRLLGLGSFSDYRALIESDEGEEERHRMVAALTTNVTRFNREPHHFGTLQQEVLPRLAAHVRGGGRLRLWSAACSSGEEPYSIALAVLAAWPEAADLDIRVLATDINAEMVARGREGTYSGSALASIPPAARERWFEPAGQDLWRAGRALSSLVVFRVMNLIGDWPMRGRFDAIFCRNVAIYFDTPSQERLWARLADATAPGGCLFIGHSERIVGPAARLFASAGITTYRRGEATS
ncbi:CheR family methyltransferase [Rubellimicrobium aerolatum]|uniref:Chemotaxis protein methyltransferase n=1 Tax=Rubellimicrobium aerolatum TaxID=490979 RepID=A0ABW0SHT4_9RHOB|nr:protein-glutamate O-methyltransferase CheR [Rubellimicrobium aerolatum]MBP1807578.1 chemotaxis protein methyltransferase CheR [Rubellimicrobium aerolatum]